MGKESKGVGYLLFMLRVSILVFIMLVASMYQTSGNGEINLNEVSAEEVETDGSGAADVDAEEDYNGWKLLVLVLLISVPFIPILGILVVLIFTSIKEKHGQRKELRLRARAEAEKEQKIGYQSYMIVRKLIQEIQERHTDSILFGLRSDVGEIRGEVLRMLDEIKSSYEIDNEIAGVKMYKYENMFNEVRTTLQRAEIKGKRNSIEVYDIIIKAIKYPYEDIVGEGIDGIVNSLREEIRIQDELKNR